MPDLLLVAATERELMNVERVPTLCCGIGPVEAAVATARALAEESYSALLHVGIAGATKLEPGTIVVGSEAVYSDVLDPNATLPRVHRIEPAPELVNAARQALPQASVLPIATAARVGGGIHCDVEAMEGFGVLRAAGLAGVPAVEVRVISNPVHDPDRSRWQIAHALSVLSSAVSRLIPALLTMHAP
jgi:nucleoside phosphorylase